MKHLYYIISWGKVKEKTWSGTCWKLLKALQERFEIVEIEYSTSSWWDIARSILRRIGIHKTFDLQYVGLKAARRTVGKSLKGSPSCKVCLQFTDIISDTKDTSTYVYQDISVSHVSYIVKNAHSVYEHSIFKEVSPFFLAYREQEEKVYYHQCAGIFTMGEWLRRDMVDRLGLDPKKVHHVGGGIDLSHSLMQPKHKECNKILFVGRAFECKGGLLVYQAFCKAKIKQPNLELHIAGPASNPVTNPCEGYFYHGDLSHSALSELFNICDIYCMPSYFEAYGKVFIEALTYGLPCIGRNAFEMPIFIEEGKTGYLIDNDDVDYLADKMLDLLHDDEIKQEVEKRRDYYIQKYSWDAVAERIMKVIERDQKKDLQER